jgi:hypothetical protein
LHTKPQGCGASVASPAGHFSPAKKRYRRLLTRTSVKLASDHIQSLTLMLGILNMRNLGLENLVNGWCVTYVLSNAYVNNFTSGHYCFERNAELMLTVKWQLRVQCSSELPHHLIFLSESTVNLS